MKKTIARLLVCLAFLLTGNKQLGYVTILDIEDMIAILGQEKRAKNMNLDAGQRLYLVYLLRFLRSLR